MDKNYEDDDENGGLPPWISTYGNLSMLLLCFFILMFSMSSVDVSKFKTAAKSFEAEEQTQTSVPRELNGEALISNGVSQLNDIEFILTNKKTATVDEIVEATEAEVLTNPTTEAELPGINNPITKVIAEDMQTFLIEQGISSDIQIAYNSNYVKLTIEGEKLFDVGKAVLKPEAETIMGSIADVIIQKKYKDYTIQIDGHTDNWDINTVEFPSNWHLSSARAIAVGNLFINQYQFNPNSIACTGYGEHKPIADNTTPEGRAKNRRVEIKLIFQTQEVIAEKVIE